MHLKPLITVEGLVKVTIAVKKDGIQNSQIIDKSSKCEYIRKIKKTITVFHNYWRCLYTNMTWFSSTKESDTNSES